jgi:thymidylate kinase
MAVFISIDGVSGVGKTTIGKMLAGRSLFQYHKSPSGPFAKLQRELEARTNAIESYCFYRFAVQYDSWQIENQLTNSNVVCDRYIASTYAYHVTRDQRVRDIHDERGLIIPHYAFCLSARRDVRAERLRSRSRPGDEFKLQKNDSFMDRVAETFLTLKLIHIDTSDLSPQAVVEHLLHYIVLS